MSVRGKGSEVKGPEDNPPDHQGYRILVKKVPLKINRKSSATCWEQDFKMLVGSDGTQLKPSHRV